MKTYLFLFYAFLGLTALGCARTQTLNLAPHQYSERPSQVLWIQLAGFSEEHIPLLKFNVSDTEFKTNLEQVDCVGKMWSFNLFQLRPSAHLSFMSQMTGTKNIQGSCSDFEHTPVWSKLEESGYAVSVLENSSSSIQSLEVALSCPSNKMIDAQKMRLFRMGPDVDSAKKSFHYQDPMEQLTQYMQAGLYYDRSCQKGVCYSSLSNNFKVLWQQSLKANSKNLFIVRDFNFQKALIKKDLGLAKESLLEIDRLVGEIKKSGSKELLIVVSGAESLPLEFPLQGKQWAEFEKNGKNLFYKTSSLISPVLASGPMSENFCGMFDEAEMYNRLLYKPIEKKFNWDYLKPF